MKSESWSAGLSPRLLSLAGEQRVGSGRNGTNERRERLSLWLQAFTAITLFLPAAIFILATGGQAIDRPLGGGLLPLAAAVAVVGLFLFTGSWRITAAVSVVAGLVHIGAYAVAGALLDNSYDGLAIHQEAVLRLANGWNPLLEDAAPYGAGQDPRMNYWFNHYPKAPWVNGAALLLSTNQIEPGKLFNLTLALAAACQAAVTLLGLNRLPGWAVAAVALLAASNPVVLYQTPSWMIDGQLASLLTLLVASLALHLVRPNARTLVIALVSTALLINVKFTGLVYAAFILAGFLVAVAGSYGWRRALQLALPVGCTGLVATFILGYGSYTRNWLEQGHIFFPVKGGGDLVEMSHMRPVNIADKDRFTRFLISNFSRSEPVRPPRAARLKFPLSASRDERRAMASVALEVGGFGPFYGALLLLYAAGLAVLALNPVTRRSAGVVAFASLVLLATIFCHTESWWARYAPQSWLLPLLVATACLAVPRRSVTWWLGVVTVLLAAANVAWVAYFSSRYERVHTGQARKSLREMAQAPQPVTAYFGPFHGLRQRLRENNLEYRLILEPPAQLEENQRSLLAPPLVDAYWLRPEADSNEVQNQEHRP